MDEKYQKLCADIADSAQPLVFNGQQGLMVNCNGMFHSQVGDLLSRQSGSFAFMWHASTKGVKVGLRSRSEFNCIPWPKLWVAVAMHRLVASRWATSVWWSCCPGPSERCRSRLPLCQGTADGV
jgi:hypothetical protein